MTFHSILFRDSADEPAGIESLAAPACFADLNLDQIVDAITASRANYRLKPFFYAALADADAIQYRHEVFQDLENQTLLESIRSFARKMNTMREQLAQADKLHYPRQKKRWFLDAVGAYADAVNGLVHDLSVADLKSRGLVGLREYVTDYSRSERFTSLLVETRKLVTDLQTVRYSLLIKDRSVTVRKYEGQADYSVSVEETFAKFKQGAVKNYRVKFSDWPDMNHVEAGVLDLVAQLFPDIFADLDGYCVKYVDYLDEAMGVFDREIEFYVAYLEYLATLKRTGLAFCYPRVSGECKEIQVVEGFDIALAYKLATEHASVVCNDFFLHGAERIFVVTGPNQGGKTTFARAVGQAHYMAGLGCPVPGGEAQLFLFDRLLTHFEKAEDITNLRGKLADDLVRIHAILDQATPRSLIIMNEIFTSTTLQDAIFLSKAILARISQLDLLCVFVTFMDELSSLNEKTVSLVSTVVPENPTQRTFKVVRRPADGLSYAVAIAEKYRLTSADLQERLKP